MSAEVSSFRWFRPVAWDGDAVKPEWKLKLATCLHETSIGHLPDIVHFHSTCLGTELFLPELTFSSTLSSNPKSSCSADPQFSHELLFYLHQFHDNFFHCSTARIDDDTRLCHSKGPIYINHSVFLLTKDLFCSNHFELCHLMRTLDVNNIFRLQLWEGTDNAF